VIIGFEHLAGVFSTSTTKTLTLNEPVGNGSGNFNGSGTSDLTSSTTRFSLFGLDGPGVFTAPKLSVDVVVTSGVTLGGSLYFYSTTTKTGGSVGGVDLKGEELTLSGYGINPRLGFALGAKPIIWLRAGIALASASTPDTDPSDVSNTEVSTATTAVSLEAVLAVIVEDRGIGFGVGPSIYLPISNTLEVGGVEPTGAEFSVSSWMISASGYFAP